MIDVHAPHEATHTWTDFFIHIATIVVGLLIAIGLEQTVELIHHHQQLAEARQQLAAERDLNREVLQKNLRSAGFAGRRPALPWHGINRRPQGPYSQLFPPARTQS